MALHLSPDGTVRPIARPKPYRPRPAIGIYTPKMGPFPLHDALAVALRHSRVFHYPYMQVTTRVDGGCELQFDPLRGDWYIKLRSRMPPRDSLDALIEWLIFEDLAVATSATWYAKAFPREEELPTMMEE